MATPGAQYNRVVRPARPTTPENLRGVFVRSVPVTDEAAIEVVSEAYQEKYGRTAPGSSRAMLQPKTLPTTLRPELA